MANQEQNPPQQELPFIAAKQVGFNLEDILFNTNNKVALLYPEHNNKDYFKCVSDFISKCCLKKPFTRSPNMYKEYLAGFWYSAKALENSKVFFSIPTGGSFGEVGVNTFRNAIGAHYLPHSSEYAAPPSIDVVRQWFSMIRYGEEVSTKGTLKKSLLPPSKEAIKGGSSKAPTGSKIGYSKKRKESSSAIDSNPSQPLVSTPMDTGMHKEDHQAAGGPTSLGVTSEARANPQLSSGMSAFNLNEPIYSASFIIHSESALGNDASAASTAEGDLGNSAPSTDSHVLVDQTKSVSEGLETVLTQPIIEKGASSVANLNSPEDDHVIVVNDSDEDKDDEVHATKNSQKYKLELEKNNVEAEAALLKAQPSFSNVEQLKELLVKSLKTKFLNITSAHDFSSSLPTELKDLPSKFNYLTEEVKGLKNQVHNLEIELLGELKEIPPRWKAKLKTLDALLSLLNKVTNSLNKFSQAIKSKKTKGDSVPSACSSQTEGEHIKKDKGKKDLSLEEAVKESTGSDYNDDETHLSGSMVESSRIKKVKKFDFVTEDGKHIHLTEEQINQRKNIEEKAKAEAAKHKSEVLKEELIDLLGP
ncbi:hypothetical protein Tco_1070639 [Tanacetum coccineum]|uniref:Uncharacterized protein n=1 Tax=Tanacetum coccineum TaxID=301880 RepID=A0ABQ5HM06_9ASTR